MIDEELVKHAMKVSGAKRISQILHGRQVLSADALNVKGDAESIAYSAHTAAKAFSMVADNIGGTKAGAAFRKNHTFIGFHDEVLCLNMPEEHVVAHLTSIIESVKAEETGGGLLSRVTRSVRKAVKS